MLNQQPPNFHPIFSTWLTWETVPLILAGPSCALALSLVLIVLGQVASGQRGLRALTFCFVVGGFTVAPGILAWERVMALLWGPPGTSSGTEGDQFGIMGAAAALADQVPSYGLVLALLASALCALLLLGGPTKRARQFTRPKPFSDLPFMSRASDDTPRHHLRAVKMEIKGRRGEDAVIVVVARLGYPALHDVILPDDLGLTQVDHLVRLPHGIAVLETKALSGWVSGSVEWRQWTQHLQGGRVRATFQNPFRQNFRHTEAVARVAGAGVPVLGLVVATGSATFCPELKGAVVQLADLAARLAGMPAVCCDQVRLDAAWSRLQAAAADISPELREAHREHVRGRRAGST